MQFPPDDWRIQDSEFDASTRNMPVPSTGICDCPRVTLTINNEWRGFVAGWIERGAYADVWPTDDQRAIDAVTEMLVQLGDDMACGCNDTPGDLIQFTSDDYFDYSTTLETHTTNLETTYNDLTQLPADFGFRFADPTPTRTLIQRKVLCLVLYESVKAWANRLREQVRAIDRDENPAVAGLDNARDILLTISGIAFVTGRPFLAGATAVAAGINEVASIAFEAFGGSGSSSTAGLRDIPEVLIENIVCYMVNAEQPDAYDYATWTDTFRQMPPQDDDSLNFVERGIWQSLITSKFTEFIVYLELFDLAGKAEGGLSKYNSVNCPCEIPCTAGTSDQVIRIASDPLPPGQVAYGFEWDAGLIEFVASTTGNPQQDAIAWAFMRLEFRDISILSPDPGAIAFCCTGCDFSAIMSSGIGGVTATWRAIVNGEVYEYTATGNTHNVTITWPAQVVSEITIFQTRTIRHTLQRFELLNAALFA